ncbi:MAG TPA: TonB-dependent receptor [Bryobacteraceae bacterium]|nr:TonB-dependent receptor [Bryobacteraceae bacterium]
MILFRVSLAIFLSLSLWAQTNGNISGYVKDPTGAVVSGAKITLTNQQTGATRAGTTDDTGFYQVLGLVSGTYSVEAELTGFKRSKTPDVVLGVDANVRADVTLQLGQVTESVEVSSAATLVDTRSSQTVASIDDRRLVDLPLNGRNVVKLAATLPGVLGVVAPDNSDVTDARGGPRMNVNGARANMNYNKFNGTYFNNPSRNTGLNVPPPDAVQEFRIQTSAFSAESGRNAGANVTVVSRQGTNQIHGAVWEFLRNDNLNARSFFQSTRPNLIQNQYGAAAGGPIKRNKAFLFGSWEATKDRRQAAETSFFPPTQAEVNGNFSALAGKQLVNPADNTPFPNNQIPASLIDPVAKNLLALVPTGSGGSLQASAPATRDASLFLIRHDLNLSDKQNLFVHYFLSQNKLAEAGLAYGANVTGWTGRERMPRAQNAGINHVWTTSATTLNQFTAGYTRSTSLDAPLITRTPEQLGIRGMPVYTNGGSPQFTISGRFSLTSGGPTKFVSNTYQLQDNFSWILRRHTLKFGAEAMDLSFFQSFLGPPSFSYNGQRTGGGSAARGDSLADFLLGGYQQLSVTNGVRNNDGRGRYYAGYVQDDWKVTSRLTLNLGVRYELATPWRDKFDAINTVYPDLSIRSKKFPNAPVGMLFPGDLPRGLYNTDKNNFAPRIGFAWDVFGDGKTAVRGAYGIFYDTINTDSIAQENPPFSGGRRAFANGNTTNPFSSVGAVAPPAYIDPSAFTFTYPINGLFSTQRRDFPTTYVNSWNFTIQRQLGQSWMVSGAYIGKTTLKLLAYRPFNAAIFVPGNDAQGRPRSTEGNAESRVPFAPGIYGPQGYYLDNPFTGSYHSAQIDVNKRFSRGLQLSANYSLAKALDSSSTTSLGGCIANPYDVRASKGRSDWDRRHSVVGSGIFTPQIYREQKGVIGRILGGWSLSAIVTLQTGAPVLATTGQNTPLDGTTCQGSYHPDIVGQIQREWANRDDMIAQFFNRSAFAMPATGRYGTAARNMFSGPGLATVDSAFLKDIAVSERMRFQFRAEFSNLFNRANFSNPIAQLANPRYGQITAATAGRAAQLGLKFLW